MVSVLGELPAPPMWRATRVEPYWLIAVLASPNLCVCSVPGPSRPPCDVYCHTEGGQNMDLKRRAGAPKSPARAGYCGWLTCVLA